jgi:hypothetical protein
VNQQLQLVDHFKIKYPVLAQDPAQALKLGAVAGLPTTFVFNPKGKLKRTLYGGQTEKSLQQAIR